MRSIIAFITLMLVVSILWSASKTPVLTGSGQIVFPEFPANPAKIFATTGAVFINAAGSINFNTGGGLFTATNTVMQAQNGFYTSTNNAIAMRQNDSTNTIRDIMWMDAANPDILHLQNNQRNAGGQILFSTFAGGGPSMALLGNGNFEVYGTARIGNGTGLGAAAYPLDVQGEVNSTTGYRLNGTLIIDSSGHINPGGSTGIIYRCATAGALPIGAITVNPGSCGSTVDTGLRSQ